VIVAGLALAGLWAAWHLRLDPRALTPGPGGWQLAREFFGHALRPAWNFEGSFAGTGVAALPLQALRAAGTTVVFAATSLSLALVAGLLLGPLGSSSLMRGPVLRTVALAVRLLGNLLRSVHELLWAVLLLAAFGRGHLVAVIAIALPYAGVLAKIFAEMIDEAPAEAGAALQLAGATAGQRFVFGLLPRAVPDMVAYTFYRFECALRSSAVLGFFGFPTLGYHLAASFENLYYGEVWTYLYVLLGLIVVVDWWSSRLRRELLA
jgi:phosphonate transport system permease protein